MEKGVCSSDKYMTTSYKDSVSEFLFSFVLEKIYCLRLEPTSVLYLSIQPIMHPQKYIYIYI